MANPSTVADKTIPVGESEHIYLLEINPGTYATGGVAIDLAGNASLKRVLVPATGGYVFEFIPSTQKLKAYRQKDPANAGGADIPLPEVANAVDLSALVLYGIGVGY